MAIVRSTRAAADWNTVNSLSIELLYDQLIHPHKFATPTFKLLMQGMKRDRLGPDMKFGWNMITKHLSPSIAARAQTFVAQSLDNIIRIEYTPSMMYNSAGTDDITMALYDSDNARLDHIDTLIASMHQGYSDAFAYELFSSWDEAITNNEIDISAALSSNPNPPEELTLGNVSAHTDRMFSLPMLLREPENGHTLANLPVTSTTNYFWHPATTDHAAAVVTRQAAGAANTDVVTAIANAQPADLDDFSGHFDEVQVGWHYANYCAVGSGLYRQLVALLLAITRRDIASPLGELGIRAAIEWQDYNATFYKDPMMTWLHPFKCFTWDPDCMFLMSDERFDPSMGTGIYGWEHIPGSTLQATGMFHIVQLVVADRRGIGSMNGYTNS
jgi:hypothetical protein